jgi:NAD(P)-dependent dehydrogenase (short-subunit alcohol dehydrogenase family)
MTVDRVALVTGGTRGIGRAITTRLAAEGVTVASVFTHDDQSADRLRTEITESGGRVTMHQIDIGEQESCERLVAEVVEQHGRLDFLVNNAGVLVEQRLADVTVDDWQRQLAVNLSGAFFLTQAAVVPMIAQRFGRIVNVGSVTAAMGSPVQVAYAAAKAGLIGLSRSVARSVARKGITVNCVIPGSIETDMSDSLKYTQKDLVTELIPMGRWGTTNELAHAVLFLLDERSSYITGSVLTVDGGMSMGA